jgi:hypothetical protein
MLCDNTQVLTSDPPPAIWRSLYQPSKFRGHAGISCGLEEYLQTQVVSLGTDIQDENSKVPSKVNPLVGTCAILPVLKSG